jgi:hypothetical protein
MEAIGGDTSLHDAEYEEAAWFALADALERLAFANEVEILQTAANMLGASTARALTVDSQA